MRKQEEQTASGGIGRVMLVIAGQSCVASRTTFTRRLTAVSSGSGQAETMMATGKRGRWRTIT